MAETTPAPRDELEAMLAEQMAAVNAAAMRALERAAECTKDHPQIEALYLRPRRPRAEAPPPAKTPRRPRQRRIR
jgi:NRPS condensation-like uncharacterized protein